MEPNVKHDDRNVEPRCGVCGAPRVGTVCDMCRGERMTPQRYAELFGEAA